MVPTAPEAEGAWSIRQQVRIDLTGLCTNKIVNVAGTDEDGVLYTLTASWASPLPALAKLHATHGTRPCPAADISPLIGEVGRLQQRVAELAKQAAADDLTTLGAREMVYLSRLRIDAQKHLVGRSVDEQLRRIYGAAGARTDQRRPA